MKTIIENEKLAADLFKSIVKGQNFMTPHVIGYFKITDGAAELTTGEFMRHKIYGVTVVKNNEHVYDLSQKFDTEGEAREYIKSLKN